MQEELESCKSGDGREVKSLLRMWRQRTLSSLVPLVERVGGSRREEKAARSTGIRAGEERMPIPKKRRRNYEQE